MNSMGIVFWKERDKPGFVHQFIHRIGGRKREVATGGATYVDSVDNPVLVAKNLSTG